MREILSIVVVATLLVAAVVDVVAAGARTGVAKNHFYYASPVSGVGIAASLFHFCLDCLQGLRTTDADLIFMFLEASDQFADTG